MLYQLSGTLSSVKLSLKLTTTYSHTRGSLARYRSIVSKQFSQTKVRVQWSSNCWWEDATLLFHILFSLPPSSITLCLSQLCLFYNILKNMMCLQCTLAQSSHSKITQTEGLNNRKYIFPQFWGMRSSHGSDGNLTSGLHMAAFSLWLLTVFLLDAWECSGWKRGIGTGTLWCEGRNKCRVFHP